MLARFLYCVKSNPHVATKPSSDCRVLGFPCLVSHECGGLSAPPFLRSQTIVHSLESVHADASAAVVHGHPSLLTAVQATRG